jgi:NADH dehydrogenase FAD-containing subunit
MLEGGDRRRGVWRAFCGPAHELKSGGRDAYRSAKLSPLPTLLYQVATGSLSAGEVASPLRSVLSRQTNTRVWLGTVVDIDPDSKRVFLADGTIVPYDSLIVASGSQTSYFGQNEWQ